MRHAAHLRVSALHGIHNAGGKRRAEVRTPLHYSIATTIPVGVASCPRRLSCPDHRSRRSGVRSGLNLFANTARCLHFRLFGGRPSSIMPGERHGSHRPTSDDGPKTLRRAHDATRRQGEGAMGADAHQPGDELTEHETRDLDDWLARMTQAMAHERECMERRLVPPDPRLTEQLGQLCAIIADVMVKHEAMITEAKLDQHAYPAGNEAAREPSGDAAGGDCGRRSPAEGAGAADRSQPRGSQEHWTSITRFDGSTGSRHRIGRSRTHRSHAVAGRRLRICCDGFEPRMNARLAAYNCERV